MIITLLITGNSLGLLKKSSALLVKLIWWICIVITLVPRWISAWVTLTAPPAPNVSPLLLRTAIVRTALMLSATSCGWAVLSPVITAAWITSRLCRLSSGFPPTWKAVPLKKRKCRASIRRNSGKQGRDCAGFSPRLFGSYSVSRPSPLLVTVQPPAEDIAAEYRHYQPGQQAHQHGTYHDVFHVEIHPPQKTCSHQLQL